MPTAVELLRKFANFQGDGIRSVIRMRRMQEEARAVLKRIDQARARAKNKSPK
jgi:hypothetical protein